MNDNSDSDFAVNRCTPRPAIAYENGRGYWKNIKGHVVGVQDNLKYGGVRYIFKYEGDLINHVGAKVGDYKDKEMFISERDVKFLD